VGVGGINTCKASYRNLVDRVALKGEVGSGVGEWGKQCWGCWSFGVFWCISVDVVEGACVRDCRGVGLCKVGSRLISR
jgi:hypothetical protein